MYELSEDKKIRLAAIVRDQHGQYLLLDKFAEEAVVSAFMQGAS